MRHFIFALFLSGMVSVSSAVAAGKDEGNACLKNCWARYPCLRPDTICTPERYQEEVEACRKACPKEIGALDADLAVQAVANLEKGLQGAEKFTAAGTPGVGSASEKSTQDKLNEEHEKARKGGYDKEFHEAIRNNGGERLKQEWKKNCNSKPLNKKELNC